MSGLGYWALVFCFGGLAAASLAFGVVSYRKAGRAGISRVDGVLTLLMGAAVWPWTLSLVLGFDAPRWVDVLVWTAAGMLMVVFFVRQTLWLRDSRKQLDQFEAEAQELLKDLRPNG